MSEPATDTQVAAAARPLAEALADFAYTRKPEDKKRVAELQAELCRVCGQQLNAPREVP